MKKPYNSRLLRYTKADEAILSAKLDAVRAAIDHPAEKGRAVEENVRQFIRALLPTEYGVSTGFIAYHDNGCLKEVALSKEPSREVYEYKYAVDDDTISISSQLDIIVYDALRFGPIARLGTCDVFPAEAVYAYIEVKSMIEDQKNERGRTAIQDMLKQSRQIREIKIRQYHVPIPTTYINTMLVLSPVREVIPIRSFAFVLETRGSLSTSKGLCKGLFDGNAAEGGFFSGFYASNVGLLCSHHSNSESDPVNGTFEVVAEENSLAAFKNALYTSLYRFPRPEKNWAPAIDRYYQLSPVAVPRMVLECDVAKGKKEYLVDADQLTMATQSS